MSFKFNVHIMRADWIASGRMQLKRVMNIYNTRCLHFILFNHFRSAASGLTSKTRRCSSQLLIARGKPCIASSSASCHHVTWCHRLLSQTLCDIYQYSYHFPDTCELYCDLRGPIYWLRSLDPSLEYSGSCKFFLLKNTSSFVSMCHWASNNIFWLISNF